MMRNKARMASIGFIFPPLAPIDALELSLFFRFKETTVKERDFHSQY
jgi:hypothetical protein